MDEIVGMPIPKYHMHVTPHNRVNYCMPHAVEEYQETQLKLQSYMYKNRFNLPVSLFNSLSDDS